MDVLNNTPPIIGIRLTGGAGNFNTVASPGFSGSSAVPPLVSIDNATNFNLSSFELSNTHYAAILVKNIPTSQVAGFIDKFYIHDSYIGIKTESGGEYVSFGQGTVSKCTIGLHCTSGNNKFLGTSFTRNKYGIFVGAGSNHAHGVIDGFTANHNETNIYCQGVTIGQAFNGGAIFGGFDGGNGNIVIETSKGILFNGTHIGSSVITIDSTSEVAFRNVLWQGTVNITVAGGGVLDAKNCFAVSGATLTLNGSPWSGNT